MLEKSENNSNYIYIINGSLAVKSTADNPEAKRRENKKGVTIYEVFYKSVSGIITKVDVKATDFGDQVNITLQSDEKFLLQFGVETSYFRTFINKLGNIDKKKEVKIAPYSFKDGEKKRSGLSFYQDGVKLENFISKENKPKGYPTWPESGTKRDIDRFNIDLVEWSLKCLSEQTWSEPAQKNPDVDFDFTAESASVGDCAF